MVWVGLLQPRSDPYQGAQVFRGPQLVHVRDSCLKTYSMLPLGRVVFLPHVLPRTPQTVVWRYEPNLVAAGCKKQTESWLPGAKWTPPGWTALETLDFAGFDAVVGSKTRGGSLKLFRGFFFPENIPSHPFKWSLTFLKWSLQKEHGPNQDPPKWQVA